MPQRAADDSGRTYGVPGSDTFYVHCENCGADGPPGSDGDEALRNYKLHESKIVGYLWIMNDDSRIVMWCPIDPQDAFYSEPALGSFKHFITLYDAHQKVKV